MKVHLVWHGWRDSWQDWRPCPSHNHGHFFWKCLRARHQNPHSFECEDWSCAQARFMAFIACCEILSWQWKRLNRDKMTALISARIPAPIWNHTQFKIATSKFSQKGIYITNTMWKIYFSFITLSSSLTDIWPSWQSYLLKCSTVLFESNNENDFFFLKYCLPVTQVCTDSGTRRHLLSHVCKSIGERKKCLQILQSNWCQQLECSTDRAKLSSPQKRSMVSFTVTAAGLCA